MPANSEEIGGSHQSAAHAQQSGRDLVPGDATGCDEEDPPAENGTSPNPLRVAGLCEDVRDDTKRRARDSNPQPVARHLISSQAANRSRTLRDRRPTTNNLASPRASDKDGNRSPKRP